MSWSSFSPSLETASCLASNKNFACRTKEAPHTPTSRINSWLSCRSMEGSFPPRRPFLLIGILFLKRKTVRIPQEGLCTCPEPGISWDQGTCILGYAFWAHMPCIKLKSVLTPELLLPHCCGYLISLDTMFSPLQWDWAWIAVFSSSDPILQASQLLPTSVPLVTINSAHLMASHLSFLLWYRFCF